MNSTMKFQRTEGKLYLLINIRTNKCKNNFVLDEMQILKQSEKKVENKQSLWENLNRIHFKLDTVKDCSLIKIVNGEESTHNKMKISFLYVK